MDKNQENIKIDIGQESLGHINSIRKWTLFISIIGFIITGIFLIIGSSAGIFLSAFDKGSSITGLPGWMFIAIILIISVLFLISFFYLYRFSRLSAEVVKELNEKKIGIAFLNLKKHYLITGIVLIIIIVFYFVAFIVSGVTTVSPFG